MHPDKRHDILKVFSQMDAVADKADMGDKIKLFGRWHGLVKFEGIAIYESEDAQAIWAIGLLNGTMSSILMYLLYWMTRKYGS